MLVFSPQARKALAVAMTVLSLSTLAQAAPALPEARDQDDTHWARLCRRWAHFWSHHHHWEGWWALDASRVHEASWHHASLAGAAVGNGSGAAADNAPIPLVPEANAGLVLIPVVAAALLFATRRQRAAKAAQGAEGRKESR